MQVSDNMTLIKVEIYESFSLSMLVWAEKLSLTAVVFMHWCAVEAHFLGEVTLCVSESKIYTLHFKKCYYCH